MNFDNALMNSVVTIALGIIGVASLAVILSKRSNTAGVIGAGGNAFSGALAVAEGPVTGFTPPPSVFGTGFSSSFPALSAGGGQFTF